MQEAELVGISVPKKCAHLKSHEKHLLNQIAAVTSAVSPSKYSMGSNPFADHAHAWGVEKQTIYNADKRVLENNMNTHRKRRPDAGTSIFDSKEKRKQVFTPLDYFKPYKRNKNPGVSFNDY